MYESDGKWRIKETVGLPEWIYDAEPQLQTVILEEV